MNESEVARKMRRGKKGVCLSPETQFKKGHIPFNKLPVGSKTIRVDKNGTSRRWIKVEEPNIWIPYPVHVWMTSSGKIPKGFILHHIDENALNDDIDNLCLVTRATHIKLHGESLKNSRPKQSHIKKKTCPDCGAIWQGRGRSIARCSPCAQIAQRKAKREYKARKKLAQPS